MWRRQAIPVVYALLAALTAGCGQGAMVDAKLPSAQTPSRPVSSLTVLHLGDSHTAADHFSGHLRTLFQKRFGHGARGMLPPGAIYRGYQPHQVLLRSEGDWGLSDAWRKPEDGPYGLSGYRLTAAHSNAALIYEVAPPDRFTHVRIGIYGGPGTGGLVLRQEGSEPLVIRTRSDRPGYTLKTVSLGRSSARIMLSPLGDGPVSLLSITLQRAGGGVTYVSHGVPGATIGLLARMDDEILRHELRTLDPELIILAFGTNEGFDDSLDEAAYKNLFEAQVRRLERLAPNARIAVAGPPDANRLSGRGRKQGSANATPGSCLTQGQAAGAEDSSLASHWSVPGMLNKVRTAQRQVARARGHAFWDWSSVMNGECGMHDWANAMPPKAFSDHVHMTDAGAEESARQFFDALMTSYGDGWGTYPYTDK